MKAIPTAVPASTFFNSLVKVCAVLCAASLLSAVALAQGITTGSVIGSLQDAQGAVVHGASVKLVEAATGYVTTSKSFGNGTFNVRNLPIGDYTITITESGFNPLSVAHVR